MPKFSVCLSRDTMEYATIEIEAKNAAEAEQKVDDMIAEDDSQAPLDHLDWMESDNPPFNTHIVSVEKEE